MFKQLKIVNFTVFKQADFGNAVFTIDGRNSRAIHHAIGCASRDFN